MGEATSPSKSVRWRVAGIAVMVSLLAYFPALHNGFVWDDRELILENALLAQSDVVTQALGRDYWSNLESRRESNYYRPLVILSFAVDRALYHAAPVGYHATSLLLHAGVAALLALYLLGIGTGAREATLGAALFAAHPALAESVAWISGRTDTLVAFFVLASLLADGRRSRRRWHIVSLATFALALLAKEAAVVVPLLAVLADVHRGRSWRRATRARVDFLCVLLAYFVVRQVVLGAWVVREAILEGGLEPLVRATGILQLAGILLWPPAARLVYGGGLRAETLLVGAAAGAVLLTALGWVALGTKRGPLRLLVQLGSVSFLPAIAAAILMSGIADRLAYLPALFWLPACVLAIARKFPPRVLLPFFGVLIVVCGIAASRRTSLWRDERTFFEAAVAAPDAAAPARFNLGIAYHDEGRLRDCIAQLEAATGRPRLAGVLYLQGLVYNEIGCDDLAMRYYRDALSVDATHRDAGNNLGVLHLDRGEFDAAARVFETMQARTGRSEFTTALEKVRLARTRPDFEATLGNDCGTPESALPLLGDAQYLNARGLDLLRRKRLEQARAVLQAALQLEPGYLDAQLNMAQYDVLRGAPDEARSRLRQILQRHPESDSARHLLRRLETEPDTTSP